MLVKEESERLIKRFTTFLNYDMLSDKQWKSPFEPEVARLVRKDAIALATIAAEEILLSSESTLFYKLVLQYLQKEKSKL